MSRKIENLNRYIDHTLLKPTATFEDIETLCSEAIEYDFRSVCVPPVFVEFASDKLVESTTDVCTVIGFPLGYNPKEIKAREIEYALQKGATELDIVIQQGLLKSDEHASLQEEIHELTTLVQKNYGTVKWIVETAYLSKEELVTICDYCMDAGADFIKTSTGFASEGANLKDVKLWKKHIGKQKLKIKASGGVRNSKDALSFIKAGADRLGCSAGVKIMKEYNEK